MNDKNDLTNFMAKRKCLLSGTETFTRIENIYTQGHGLTVG